jgi:OOP family OmpA-OmpF porin
MTVMRIKMNSKLKYFLALSLATISMQAFAEYAPYWVGSDGSIVRSGSGGCVRTVHWTPKDAAICDALISGKTLPAAKKEEAGKASSAQTSAVAAPVVAAVPADSDNDGVADSQDKCADSPADKPVDAEGCTIVCVVLKDVQFENNSSELTPDSTESLDKAVAAMGKYGELKIEIQAYSDSMGDAAYNQALSEKRANSVRDYMISEGVAADRLTAKGYGEANPIASNSTREGRAKNRRVELKIIE